jgi:hypothetical protein
MTNMSIRFYGQLRNIPQDKLPRIRELFRDFELFEQENALDFEYEGMYMDHEPYLEEIQAILGEQANGQADFIDLIEWKMFRYVIDQGTITEHAIPLNEVLEKYNTE